MLASFGDVLPRLEDRRVCLPGFDIAGGQPDFLLGVLRACAAAHSPALLLVWGRGATYLGLDACVELVKFYAARAPVPVVLHLDHARDEADVQSALELGFRSVMFDGSSLPLEENVRRTKAMVELGHARGASVEGELGVFGQEQAEGGQAGELTDPARAEEFVRRTGVDLLAPAVGNAHGFYRRPPRLRFDLIEQIARRAARPLSLHGGTGIPASDVRRAAELGVRKMNVATQIHHDYTSALTTTAAAGELKAWGWTKILQAGRDAVAAAVAQYLKELHVEGLA